MKKALSESSIFDRINMEVKGREHARRVKQLHKTIEHAQNLAFKHLDHATLHDEIGEDPSHPNHRDPFYHEEKSRKHMRKYRMLRDYVKAFEDEMDE